MQQDWKFRQYFLVKPYEVARHQPTIFFEISAVVGSIAHRGGDLAVDVLDVQPAVWEAERRSITRTNELTTYQEAVAMDWAMEAGALRGTGGTAGV